MSKQRANLVIRRSLNDPQPAPVPRPDRAPSWSLVIEDASRLGIPDEILTDMRERDRMGRAKYGTPLTAGDGRDHLVDAYQEALDFAVYLRQELDERGLSPDAVGATYEDRVLLETYGLALATIVNLRDLIDFIAAGGPP